MSLPAGVLPCWECGCCLCSVCPLSPAVSPSCRVVGDGFVSCWKVCLRAWQAEAVQFCSHQGRTSMPLNSPKVCLSHALPAKGKTGAERCMCSSRGAVMQRQVLPPWAPGCSLLGG